LAGQEKFSTFGKQEIWHDDANRAYASDGQVKFRSFERTAAILKNQKSAYLLDGLTDRHEIWHGDAIWPFKSDGQENFPTFENPDGGWPPSR